MGPLHGLRVIELAGLGPGPYCAMLLADLGADVVRIDRASLATGGHDATTRHDLLSRGKRSIALDLKRPEAIGLILGLVERSDALIEGFRPGVMERLGLGPDVCLSRNAGLVYGRVTGWGQSGPLAATAGHDIDYLAVAGGLHPIGSEDRPYPPLNYLADFGGGGMLLAVGLLAAIINARSTGQGQVVDAAMVDGVAHLGAMVHGMLAAGLWTRERRSNLLDGGAPFYDVYSTSDGEHMAVGALEPQFFAQLIDRLECPDVGDQMDRDNWPAMRRRFSAVFASKTRDEWVSVFAGSDACVAPVMDLAEAPFHPHLVARRTFVESEGITQPAPAPRFEATPAAHPGPPVFAGRHTREILSELGLGEADISRLLDSGVAH